MQEVEGRLPDSLIACIGGGSNAMGLFHPFLDDPTVEIFGVEAAGHGLTQLHAASIAGGRPGVLHGNRTYLADGRGRPDPGCAFDLGRAGLSRHRAGAFLAARDRPRHLSVSATDDEALAAFQLLSRLEGIIPALEPAHAIAKVMELAPKRPRDHLMVVNLSGRGDKDVPQVGEILKGEKRPCEVTTRIDAHRSTPGNRSNSKKIASGRAAFVTFVMAGDPDPATSLEGSSRRSRSREPRIIRCRPSFEIGMPFTDPMADGPSIQAAGLRALKAGMTLKKTLEMVRDFRKDDNATPLVLMGYYNPIYIYGVDRFSGRCQGRRRRWPDHRRSAAGGRRRAVPAGDEGGTEFHSSGDARPPTTSACLRCSRTRRALSITSRSPASPAAPARFANVGRRSGRPHQAAYQTCRSASASASARRRPRATSPRRPMVRRGRHRAGRCAQGQPRRRGSRDRQNRYRGRRSDRRPGAGRAGAKQAAE